MSTNPWLAQPEEAELDPEPVVQTHLRATGPTSPQRGVPAPLEDDRLPLIHHEHNADVWWVGVHGGSGASTLSTLVDSWADAGHGWPQVPGDEPARVVLVSRTNMRGLQAAQAAVTQWASGLVPDVELLGYALVADAPGKLPKPLREMSELVRGGFPRAWGVPWIESWRLGEPADLEKTHRAVRRLVADLRELAEPNQPAQLKGK